MSRRLLPILGLAALVITTAPCAQAQSLQGGTVLGDDHSVLVRAMSATVRKRGWNLTARTAESRSRPRTAARPPCTATAPAARSS